MASQLDEQNRSLLARPWSIALDPARRDGRILSSTHRSPQAEETADFPDDLNPDLRAALEGSGIERLYSHQREAWEISRKSGLVLTTGTASGKSLAFNLPVLDSIADDPKDRAIYLYPTKALAQDQARALGRLRAPNLRHAIYDGDTPKDERPAIRRRSNLVLTNPDMLHIGILPHHRSWGDFLTNLKWVVIDEAHTYRGVFGSNVANVIRRLRRIAAAYGSEPRFLLASATIANPQELGEKLTGAPIELVSNDGAPQSSRETDVWNPPLINPAIGSRRSVLAEAADLVADLVSQDIKTICFLRSRRGIELIRKFTIENLTRRGRPELAEKVAPYRAGYTPQQRRKIESDLVEGRLLGVISTDALELGIDIGELDAAICVTFPGTVAGLRQMWGRAGRTKPGLAVYIAGQDALDQYFCRHPDEFLDRAVEAAILDHNSPEIAAQHLVAAAFELPITAEDKDYFGDRLPLLTESLLTQGKLRKAVNGLVPHRPGFVAADISLRSSSASNVAVVDRGSGEVIGTVETGRAFTTLHPGAVYMHLGKSFEVEQLDLDNGQALVHEFEDEWYTRPKMETDIFIERVIESKFTNGIQLSFGEVTVTDQVIAFQRISTEDQEAIDLIDLELPEQEFKTQGLWYTVPKDMTSDLPLNALLGALHATEHSQIAVLPLIAMCDRWDIGGLSTNIHYQTGEATIFIYDGHPGGIGITRRGFEMFDQLVSDALGLVGECPCEQGCPSCVQSPKCGNLNEPLFKQGAIDLMQTLVQSR